MTPPPLPPPAVSYASTPAVRPWSPWPLAATAAVGVGLLAAAMAVVRFHFEPAFKAFRVEVPPLTAATLTAADATVRYRLWAPALVAAVVVPWAVVPRVAAPASADSRRRVVRTVRLTVLLLALAVGLLLVVAMVEPLIALIQAVSGPHK